MHRYLKAIGFDQEDHKKEVNSIVRTASTNFHFQELAALDQEMDFSQFRLEYSSGIGISVCGTMDQSECFTYSYYFPYFAGTGITSTADIVIKKKMDKEAYVGICEDSKVGISLMFYLQNIAEYLSVRGVSGSRTKFNSVTFSGLCNKGMILLPIQKSTEMKKKSKEKSRNRMMLLSAARNGDVNAMESLTIDDMDMYTKVSKRLVKEDVFTIVDTYIMPYGIECDCYSILGEILDIHKTENKITKESLYVLKLDVNELQFDVCVPEKNVFGEPEIGRRFKGNIWLQGRVNFDA